MTARLRAAAAQLSYISEQMYLAKAIALVAGYCIPDVLIEGALSTEELASASGTHPPSLYRLLRLLASIGVFVKTDSRCFRLGPLGHSLRRQ